MNVKMWQHPILQQNLKILKNIGIKILNPDTGELACGYKGTGRMMEPQQIVDEINAFLGSQSVLLGKKSWLQQDQLTNR